MDIAVYGAQGMALGAYEALRHLFPSRKVLCFLVTERGTNADRLAGIPVLELKHFSDITLGEEKKNIEVLIATPEAVMPEIEKNLDVCGFSAHVRLTSARWAILMGYHYAGNGAYMPLSAYPVGCRKADLCVFMAKCHMDKPLKYPYTIPKWVTPIQTGAVLCEKRIADIQDCQGEHISEKNKNYSELTALYWIWRNRLIQQSKESEREYYGLVHYRRILDLSEDDVLRLMDNHVDVVLPYPMPYEPNIGVHHARYVKEEDWEAVLTAVGELEPTYAKSCSGIMKQRYFYNYNILIARKQILESYCRWLFPILQRVEELSVPKGRDRDDRYIGYIGESLLTLYFMANQDRLAIAHAGCRFLI